ncbi:MAG: DegT/DnrJ/EryC1/StrS aminotransferase family protein [Gemmatimonadetes bacterium]|nr:DegT/DnrJ/EryC1/StrS aminotransferase family protein [Gemmatimonadota bacterium]
MRHQLPAYSPLTFRAIANGCRALGWSSSDVSDVEAIIRSVYEPRTLVATNSGTSALMVALQVVKAASPGLPVAMPAYCCYDVATAADGAGVPVVLYDVDPGTLGPDFDSLRAVAREGLSAVVAVHLFGIPVDMTELAPIAEDAGAVVIEDAAQGAGASLRGRPLGGIGSMGILSFGRGKARTAGRGGALLANDAHGAKLIAGSETRLVPASRGLGELAAIAAQWLLGRPALYGLPVGLPFLRLGETVYRPPSVPAVLSPVAARVLAATWPLSSEEAQARRRNAARLQQNLPLDAAWRVPIPPAGAEPGFLRFPVVVTSTPLERLLTPQVRRLGVMPGYPRSLADLRGFRHRNVNPTGTLVGARTLAASLLTLPTHGLMSERDLGAIEEWLRSIRPQSGGVTGIRADRVAGEAVPIVSRSSGRAADAERRA